MKPFTNPIIETLQAYVYLYIDPRDKQIFYIGKGKGNRAFDHLAEERESEKVARIKAIKTAGLEPQIELLMYGLSALVTS